MGDVYPNANLAIMGVPIANENVLTNNLIETAKKYYIFYSCFVF